MRRQTKEEEIEVLKERLAEAEETLRAIRCGEVDALVINKPEGQQVYTLEGAEKPHRLLVEAMNEGAMTLNAAGTILYCNARLAEMAKRPLEQVIGSSWQQLFPGSEQSSFKALLKRARKHGSKGEYSLLRGEGKLLPVQVSARSTELLGMEVFAVLLTDISALNSAKGALRQANERLEQRVRQRTLELTQANETLQAQSEELRAANEELQTQSEELQTQAEELRVQADEVRESEQRFRSLFEQALDAVFLTVPDGRVMAANPAACAMFGASEQELCRAGRAGIIDPHDHRFALAQMERSRTGSFRGELTCIRQDGTKFEADVSSVRVASEEPRSFVIVRDISARKRVEREREQLLDEQRRQKEFFEKLFANASMGVAVVGRDLRYVLANPAYHAIPGTPGGSMTGRTIAEVFPPPVAQVVEGYVQKVFQSGEPLHIREYDIVIDGQRTCWNVSEVPLRDAAGGVESVLILTQEVTERKLAEESLRQSEYRFRIMGETVDYGVWMCNKEGGAEYASQSFLELLNMSLEEMKPFGWTQRLPPEDVAPMMEKWLDCVRTGKVWDSEHRIIDRQGKIHTILTRGKPVRDAQGTITSWVGLNLDITERKKTEEALAAAKEQLRQYAEDLEKTVQERTARLQETVEELEHFSYTITHDMRAPLRAMQGFGHMLLSECADCLHPHRSDLIRRIADSAGRMDSLITDALNYSKIMRQEFKLEPVDAAKLLRGIVESYPQFQPPQAEVKLEGNIPLVLGNEAGMTQCFSNLLGNAVKFVHPDQVPQVRVWAESRADYVRFWFEDNGIGIARQYHDQIFAMFQKLDKSYAGTGIGLALVQKSVERMKGQVGVESEEGKGSRFWVELKRGD